MTEKEYNEIIWKAFHIHDFDFKVPSFSFEEMSKFLESKGYIITKVEGYREVTNFESTIDMEVKRTSGGIQKGLEDVYALKSNDTITTDINFDRQENKNKRVKNVFSRLLKEKILYG